MTSRRRYHRFRTGGFVLLFTINSLLLTVMHPGSLLVTAAQDDITVIEEVEPNDDLKSGQIIDFAGKSTILIRGRAATADQGLLPEELSLRFQDFEDSLEDYYILPMDDVLKQLNATGKDDPIQISAMLNWSGQTDMDLWVFTDVDDSLFFLDGLKFLSFDAATEENPEHLPRSEVEAVAFYPQPENEQAIQANLGFSRKLIFAVSNFAGPETDYELTIKLNQAKTEKHITDDGDPDAAIGGPPGSDLTGISLVGFQPTRYPVFLRSVNPQLIAFRDQPDPTGEQVRVIVLKGATLAEPPPSLDDQASVLFDGKIRIPGTIRLIGEDVPLMLPTPIRIESGVVFVGIEIDEQASAKGIRGLYDISPVQYLNSWFSSDGGKTWSVLTAPEDVSGERVVANFACRAVFERIEPSPSVIEKPSAAVTGRSRSVRVGALPGLYLPGRSASPVRRVSRSLSPVKGFSLLVPERNLARFGR